MREQKDPMYLAGLYKQIFEDDVRGREIYEDLVRRFNKGASTTGGIDAILKTYINLGESKPIQYILNQIDRANGVDTPTYQIEE